MSDFREIVFSPWAADVKDSVGDDQNDGITFAPSPFPLDRHSEETSLHPSSPVSSGGDQGEGEEDSSSSNSGLVGGNSTVWGASFNFVNSIVGAGIIGIPLAIQQCGFIAGMLCLALVAFLIDRSVIMLIDCGMTVKKYDLEALAEHLLGPFGYYLAVISMMLYAYGGMAAYLVILGDTVPMVSEVFLGGPSWLSNRKLAILFFSTVIILPLSLLKDLSHLSWTSFLSISADLVLILVLLLASKSASEKQSEHFEAHDLSEFGLTMFTGVGTMSFAFVCQHNSFMVFKTLSRPTLSNWKRVAGLSIFSAYLLCLALGLIGFFAFYPHVDGDLLNNFPKDYLSVTIGRLLLAISMVFTYPMECYVARHCLHSLARRLLWKKKSFRLVPSQHRSLMHDNNNRKVGEEGKEEGDVICFDEDLEASMSPSKMETPLSMSRIAFLPNALRSVVLGLFSSSSRSSSSSTSTASPTSSTSILMPSISRKHKQLRYFSQPLGNYSNSDEEEDREDAFEEVSLDASRHNNNPTDSGTNADGSNKGFSSFIFQDNRSKTQSQASAHFSPLHSSSGHPSSSRQQTFQQLPQGEMGVEMVRIKDLDQSENKRLSEEHKGFESSSRGEEGQSTTTTTVEEEEEEEEYYGHDHIGNQEHVLVTLILWISTMSIALVARKLGLVSSLTGVAAASTLGYTLPAMIYIRAHQSDCMTLTVSSIIRKFALPLFMVCFGVASFVIGMVTIFSSL
eukprot:gene2982-3250_t